MVQNYSIEILLIVFIFISSILCKDFKVYWNIPTFMCRRYNYSIINITQQYNIIHNDNDDFRGNQIAILYDPGIYPAILQNQKTKDYIYRNHGVPQEGDLQQHLQKFQNDLKQLIPNRNFSGIAIIDFELWRPIYRQNFGTLKIYKDLSTFIERQRHPFWNEHRINNEASKRFEKSAQSFILDTLLLAKKLRPNAKWGYYGLPFCFNGRGNNIKSCPDYVKKENNGMQWLIDDSDLVLPSVYLNEQLLPSHRVPMIQGRIEEAMRMAKRVQNKIKPKTLVYHRFNFADTLKYLSEVDQLNALSAIKQSGADGVILWGSSNDFNTRDKCEKFYEYLVDTLGPVIGTLNPTYSVQSNTVFKDDFN